MSGKAKAKSDYVRGVMPRIKKLSENGVSLNALFDHAEIARSNWSRWSSGDTSPTLKTHQKFLASVEYFEKKIARRPVVIESDI